jgi:hypothetical protein
MINLGRSKHIIIELLNINAAIANIYLHEFIDGLVVSDVIIKIGFRWGNLFDKQNEYFVHISLESRTGEQVLNKDIVLRKLNSAEESNKEIRQGYFEMLTEFKNPKFYKSIISAHYLNQN